ncbi:Uncharacterised protein [Pseudomonas fluorescens]|uniref:Uncharacterized protein n=1 Tax=Pseudomonas fluorescens TaxID=294 RepID=A0A448E0Z3_PSEFL|nr:Uncharacterised protein [Pseudomonas fluorescens]
MTEPYIVTGSYVVQREHALQDSPLDRALELMEGTALRFSLDAISDEKIRASYLRNIKRMSLQTIEDVKAGRITAQEGVAFSHEMRNKILMEHRKLTSAQGLAVVQRKKQDGRTLKWLLDRYSNDLFKKVTRPFQRQSSKRFITPFWKLPVGMMPNSPRTPKKW